MLMSAQASLVDPRGLFGPVLAAFCVPQECLGVNVPCPFCGGDDRFTFREGNGIFFCRQCGRKGNGWDFIKLVLGTSDMVEVRRRVHQVIQTIPVDVRRHAREFSYCSRRELTREQEEYRWSIWEEKSKPYTFNDPVGRYLNRRLGFLPETTEVKILRDRYSTWMVARYAVGINGGYTLHLTNMDISALPRRRLADGPRPLGGAVQLMPMDERKIIGVAEGLETSWAAARIFGIPVHAALDKYGLGTWKTPEDATSVQIFPDNDEDGGSLIEAQRLQARCDVRCLITMPDPIPGLKGTDWNDVLLQQRERR
jgi:putative DNA primase/helicase